MKTYGNQTPRASGNVPARKKNKGLRSPLHGFCRFVLYLCLFAAVPHLLRPRQKAQHQKHRADCLFTHLLRLGRAALDFAFAVQFIL